MSTVAGATHGGNGTKHAGKAKQKREQKPDDAGAGPSGLADTNTGIGASTGASSVGSDTGFSAIA